MERNGGSHGSEHESHRSHVDLNYDRPLPRYDDRPPPPPPDGDMFRFRGAANRPRDNYESYRPPAFSHGGGDSYRPGGSSSHQDNARAFDFNFQGGNAPSFAPSTDYPSARRAPRPQGPRRGDRSRDTRGGRGGRGRGRGGWVPKRAGDRELLRTEREPTPEQLPGMNDGSSKSRFRDFDELSESGSEAAMDIATPSDGDDDHTRLRNTQNTQEESDSEDEHPRAKRARVHSPKPTIEEAKPKWSNPDPYTVLPPPDETQSKRGTDVLKLIRKAKLEAAKPESNANAASDFISLNFDDDKDDNKSGSESGELSHGEGEDSQTDLSLRRTFSHLDNLHPDRVVAPAAPAAAEKGINMSLPAGRLDVWPPPAPTNDAVVRDAYDAAVEKQENTDITATARGKNVMKGKKRKRQSQDIGDIIEEWITPGDADPTPWLNLDASGWPTLHREILDFYDYVRPRDYEEHVRSSLVQRIQRAIQPTFQDVKIKPFGSFASGLYLPTADMDLVAVSSDFLSRGIARIATNNQMRKFARCLETARIVKPGSLTVITGARVPIIKLVDRETGLRVDVSFENNSGLIAQRTFEDWKQQYPAMPIIVSLIKQFLVMRGMSEVFSGGLGGYSVICLVVSVIRHLQQKKGPEWDQLNHLDHILMEFLIHYGEEFDRYGTGIQMEPWGYVNKAHYNPRGAKRAQPDRLLIIDPNKYDNDISGGSKNVEIIFDAFRRAYDELNYTLDDVEETYEREGETASILERVWGGNYGLFEIQRARLRSLSSGQTRTPGFQAINAPNTRFSAPQPVVARAGPTRVTGQTYQAPPGPAKRDFPRTTGTRETPIDLGGSSDDDVRYKKRSRSNAVGKNIPKSVPDMNAHNGVTTKVDTLNQLPSRPAKVTNEPAATNAKPPKKEKRNKKKKKEEAENPAASVMSKKEAKKEKLSEVSRALAFKKAHPGILVPDRMSRGQFKSFTKKHGAGNAS